ncbi:MAG: methylmalonyl-CoA mutase [Chlamydiales bacterium]|jgi:methylmalonyl-CoA mutase
MKTDQIFRIVTASSLFDGHDAAINMFRRLFQKAGLEVIHIGHNRSVHQIITTAIQEDVDAVCISSYQGGHMEFFKFLRDSLIENESKHVKIFGGGGGTILPSEIEQLHDYGITRLYHAEDGRSLGLDGVIRDSLSRMERVNRDKAYYEKILEKLTQKEALSSIEMSKAITLMEQENLLPDIKEKFLKLFETEADDKPIVLGITGPGGAGKSSLVDELVTRFLYSCPEGKVAILAFDPTKKKTGGGLLGDRIRMNSIYNDRVFLRSMATRDSGKEVAEPVLNTLNLLKRSGIDLLILETTGIGQGNAAVVELSDISMYVMTSEYGASTQLEKIDMIDYADIVVLNKFDKMGAEDAFEDVIHAYANSHNQKATKENRKSFPIFGTIASDFNNPEVTKLFLYVMKLSQEKGLHNVKMNHDKIEQIYDHQLFTIIPAHRTYYLGEIAEIIQEYKVGTREKAKIASKIYQFQAVKKECLGSASDNVEEYLDNEIKRFKEEIGEEAEERIRHYTELMEKYSVDELEYKVRDKVLKRALFTSSLSDTRIPKIALPRHRDWGDVLTFMRMENFPGHFPYTAGVFPLKNVEEDPKRQFAGEGGPERTNKRFHYLSRNDNAKRLSTAFDSVTLYGEDPAERPDIYGKIGNSGVSIATLDHMKTLFKGFDLSDRLTSVSLTINGPAPMILAMYMNAAIDFEVEKEEGKGRDDIPKERYKEIRGNVLSIVRGTVQADILKEEQAQNTCIFSSKFSLKIMGDIQEYFIAKNIRNFYSVSISGYHIAEAGANPITQLALTLANGFTYVEYYLSRGMPIDDFAANLSFFFSSGLDPEYSVIGRVARRIWAVTMRNKYGANDRSCKLKYHIQTSGRSLHAQEIDFNDIRTTLQALMAIYDHCNSLHTNAYDEAITTPTEESVRRAMAIQLILTKEYGVTKCENPMQGSFFYDELTDLVEEAVLSEFESLSRRGGVFGAMEKQYQRHRIQTESMKYEMQKSTGELPIIGVNTFVSEDSQTDYENIEVIRATEEEKQRQIHSTQAFVKAAGSKNLEALESLRRVALSGGNIFEELMETVKYASLGQITHLLDECGGEFRRSM